MGNFAKNRQNCLTIFVISRFEHGFNYEVMIVSLVRVEIKAFKTYDDLAGGIWSYPAGIGIHCIVKPGIRCDL